MTNDVKRSSEEEYFAKQNRSLADQLRQQAMEEKEREQLGTALGIKDEAVIKGLMKECISLDSVLALALLPLVQVAWADGNLDASEKAAILKASESRGVKTGTPAHKLLEGWLTKPPSSALVDSWKGYITTLKGNMEHATFRQLGVELLRQARGVAEAAGGFLGLGSKVSDAEARELTRLEEIFKV